MAADEFFLDYLTTAIGADEILTSIRVPKLGAGWSSHYEKFNRVAQAWSIVAVAALVKRENGSISEARIGLTNMGSTPLRAAAVEQALAGADASAEAIGAAAQHAADGTSPPSDLSGKADYREHLARVLTKRAVVAAGRLSDGSGQGRCARPRRRPRGEVAGALVHLALQAAAGAALADRGQRVDPVLGAGRRAPRWRPARRRAPRPGRGVPCRDAAASSSIP